MQTFSRGVFSGTIAAVTLVSAPAAGGGGFVFFERIPMVHLSWAEVREAELPDACRASDVVLARVVHVEHSLVDDRFWQVVTIEVDARLHGSAEVRTLVLDDGIDQVRQERQALHPTVGARYAMAVGDAPGEVSIDGAWGLRWAEPLPHAVALHDDAALQAEWTSACADR